MLSIDPALPPVSPPLSKQALGRFLNRARSAVGLPGTVEVLLTTNAALKQLNRTWRGKNKATDVLSFPAFVPDGFPVAANVHAGDLAISVETAARQAASFGHSLTDELRILLLHGLLHLSGMDHEHDSGEMAAREVELRIELRLPNSLIDRVERQPARPKPSARLKSATPGGKPVAKAASRSAATPTARVATRPTANCATKPTRRRPR